MMLLYTVFYPRVGFTRVTLFVKNSWLYFLLETKIHNLNLQCTASRLI